MQTPATARLVADPGSLDRVTRAVGKARRLVDEAAQLVGDASRDHLRLTGAHCSLLIMLDWSLRASAGHLVTADEDFRAANAAARDAAATPATGRRAA